MDFLSRATASSDHHGQEGIPEEPDYAIRCYATKHSWRGRYKRVFCVSSSAIITLDPHSLSSTNHYTLVADYEGIVVAPPLGGKEDGQPSSLCAFSCRVSLTQQLEFTINVRTDGRGKYKPIKFSARHRASLLTELHRVVAALHPHPPRPLTTPSTVFPVLCLRRRSQTWVPRAMRISPVGIEVIQAPVEAVSAASTPATTSRSSSVASIAAAVRWSVEFQGLSSPALTVLASPEEAASSAGASSGGSSGGFFGVRRGVAGREDGGFILRLGFGRRAKAITATGGCSNSAILSKIVDTAKGSIGRALTVDTTSRPSVTDFVSQTAVGGVGPNEPPLGEWSVTLVRHSALLPDPSPRASSAAAGGAGATSSSSSNSNSVAGGGVQGGLGVEMSGSARQFAVTRHYFVERNPVTYEATYMRQLSTVSALVRWVEEPQLLALEFVDGAPILVYRCAARDSLLSALKDAIETEGDQLLVKHLAAAAKDAVADGGTIPGSKTRLWRRVREFNACVPYSGLSAGVDVPDVVVMAVLSMLPSPPVPPPAGTEAAYDEAGAYSAAAILPAPSPRAAGTHIGLLACLRRLVGASGAFSLVVGMPGAVGRIMGLVRSGSEAVAAEALGLLRAIIALPVSLRNTASQIGAASQGTAAASTACNKAMAARAAAKAAFFPMPVQVAAVVNRLKPRSVSPLLSAAAVAVVEALVCSPDSDTTQDAIFHETLRQVANLKRRLFSLFAHPAEGTREAVAVIMCTIAEEDEAAARPMRDAALQDGAFLRHLSNSVAAAGGERRDLSRQLIALWAEGHDPSLDLIRRCCPPGLCAHLYSRRDTSAALPGQQQVGRKGRRRVSAAAAAIGRRRHGLGGVGAGGWGSAGESMTGNLGVGLGGGQMAGAGSGEDGQFSAAAADFLSQSTPFLPSSRPQDLSISDLWPAGAASASALASSEASTAGGGLNWERFWHEFAGDHCRADLIWNERTRQELREALQGEVHLLDVEQERFLGGGGAEEERREEKEGLEKGDSGAVDGQPDTGAAAAAAGGGAVDSPTDSTGEAGAAAVGSIRDPAAFFRSLYHRFLREADMGLVVDGVDASQDRARLSEWCDPTGEDCFGGAQLQQPAAAAGDEGAVEGGASKGEGQGGQGGKGGKGGKGGGAVSNAVRELCARAMAIVYGQYGAVIGPFDGTAHVTLLLDRTLDRTLRHRLLLLLKALVRVQENASACVAVGGCELAVDLLCSAHDAHERTSIPLQSNLLAAAAYTEPPKEWFYMLPNGGCVGPSNLLAATAYTEPPKEWFYMLPNGGRVGPVLKAAVQQARWRGEVDWSTRCWAAGWDEWRRVCDVRELRWAMATGVAILTPAQVHVSLSDSTHPAFMHLISLLPSFLPPACPTRCLPHLAQAILTNEPAIVEKAALLLEEIVRYNPTVATRLYTTGVYFFVFAYAGSNFGTLASLCHATHTRQAYVSGIEAADMASQPLAKRSILGVLLPESLLYVLDRRGAAAFAAAVVADSDSPELIWTHAMRGSVLIPQILSHLGDFPQRLSQFSRALYDHTPMPPISYPELKDEMWCHRYYLRNLCDEIRFPDWPIVEHVEFLQSLLAMWREELARKPMGISDEEACAILEIPTDKQQPASAAAGTAFPATRQGVQVDEDVLKRQYRRMAVRYHPDKNPEGRDKFIAVQKAYEHLQSAMQGLQGPQTWRVLLLLRTQIILFRRYPGVLEPFKYAGFPLLLQLLRLEDGDGEAGAGNAGDGAGDGAGVGAVGGEDGGKAWRQQESASSFLSPERSELLQAATHLLWLICACSSLNGEELLRDGGLPLLTTLLSRCLSLLSPSSSPTDPPALIATHILRTLAILSAFPSARTEVRTNQACAAALVPDLVVATELESTPGAVEAALEGIFHLALSKGLRERLLRAGALWYLLPLLFKFDSTADTAGGDTKGGGGSSSSLSAGAAVTAKADSGGGALLLSASQFYQSSSQYLALPSTSHTISTPLPSTGTNGTRINTSSTTFSSSTSASASAVTGVTGQSAIGANVQSERNLHAVLAARAIARLTGYLREKGGFAERGGEEEGWGEGEGEEGSADAAARAAVKVLLTPRLAARLAENSPVGLLKALTSNVESPQVIWSSGMRAQLLRFLEDRRAQREADGSYAVDACQTFVYTALEDEIQVGDIYLRLFIQHPDFPLSDPESLSAALVPFLLDMCALLPPMHHSQSHHTPLHPAAVLLLRKWDRRGVEGGEEEEEEDRKGEGEEEENGGEARIRHLALAVLTRLTGFAPSVAAMVSDRGSLLMLLLLLVRSPQSRPSILGMLQSLAGTPELAWVVAKQGGVVFLLALLLPAPGDDIPHPIRVTTALLLSALLSQPLHGPRVFLSLSRFLPQGLLSFLRDGSGEAAIAALSQTTQTPELVWSPALALNLGRRIAVLAAEVVRMVEIARRSGGGSKGGGEGGSSVFGNLASFEWDPPDLVGAIGGGTPGVASGAGSGGPGGAPGASDNSLLNSPEEGDEWQVGGVYIRLFLKDPKYPLRNPKRFLEGLLDQYVLATSALFAPASPAPAPAPTAAASGTATAAAVAGRGLVGAAAVAAAAERVELLATALISLLRVQPLLSEHVALLGYVPKLLLLTAAEGQLLTASAPSAAGAATAAAAGAAIAGGAGGGVAQGGTKGGVTAAEADAEARRQAGERARMCSLKILHQIAANGPCAEALAVPGANAPQVIALLMRAIGWAGAAVLALETMKRLLAPTNRSRDVIVAQALRNGLVQVLLAILDWRAGGKASLAARMRWSESEAAVGRVLTVEILRLLGADGAYSIRVQEILNGSEVWRAFKDQKHDLFLPTNVQSSGAGVAGLLQGAGSAALALPALALPASAAPPTTATPAAAPAAAPAVAAAVAPGATLSSSPLHSGEAARSLSSSTAAVSAHHSPVPTGSHLPHASHSSPSLLPLSSMPTPLSPAHPVPTHSHHAHTPFAPSQPASIAIHPSPARTVPHSTSATAFSPSPSFPAAISTTTSPPNRSQALDPLLGSAPGLVSATGGSDAGVAGMAASAVARASVGEAAGAVTRATAGARSSGAVAGPAAGLTAPAVVSASDFDRVVEEKMLGGEIGGAAGGQVIGQVARQAERENTSNVGKARMEDEGFLVLGRQGTGGTGNEGYGGDEEEEEVARQPIGLDAAPL
ncbi:unnamed protein product [Closterium sp. NIES-65]|nr:unnamed protein product [Closterium sp. NIES-65]